MDQLKPTNGGGYSRVTLGSRHTNVASPQQQHALNVRRHRKTRENLSINKVTIARTP
jgi:hypothetical protein